MYTRSPAFPATAVQNMRALRDFQEPFFCNPISFIKILNVGLKYDPFELTRLTGKILRQYQKEKKLIRNQNFFF